MRALKGYDPPEDVVERFAAVCRETLQLESGVDLKAVRLDDDAEKGGESGVGTNFLIIGLPAYSDTLFWPQK